MAAPSVLIAEDQVLLREGLARLLEEQGFDVVAQAGDADDLIRKAAAHRPDVAIVDVQMPPDGTDDGLRAAIRLRRELPDMGVLVFSQFLDERYPLDLIGDDAVRRRLPAQGPRGRHRRRSPMRCAASPPAARRSTRRSSRAWSGAGARTARSTPSPPREREVLGLMAEGKSNQGIAEALVVSLAAVEKHVTHIFAKLDIGHAHDEHRRVMAVLTLLRAS